MKILDELNSCLYGPTYGTGGMGANIDFESWLLRSHCSKVGPYLKEDRFINMRQEVVYTCLQEIFDVLMRCPKADYFWYNPSGITENSQLAWLEPGQSEEGLPKYIDPLRVNKEKIKVFLRDIKINQVILN